MWPFKTFNELPQNTKIPDSLNASYGRVGNLYRTKKEMFTIYPTKSKLKIHAALTTLKLFFIFQATVVLTGILVAAVLGYIADFPLLGYLSLCIFGPLQFFFFVYIRLPHLFYIYRSISSFD